MAGDSDIPERFFGRSRIIAGLTLIAVAAFLCIWDALSIEYAVEPGPLGFLIGGGGAFLGVEWLGKVIVRFLPK